MTRSTDFSSIEQPYQWKTRQLTRHREHTQGEKVKINTEHLPALKCLLRLISDCELRTPHIYFGVRAVSALEWITHTANLRDENVESFGGVCLPVVHRE
jgi:hypothetical protein